jgi:hypothetical protein
LAKRKNVLILFYFNFLVPVLKYEQEENLTVLWYTVVLNGCLPKINIEAGIASRCGSVSAALGAIEMKCIEPLI